MTASNRQQRWYPLPLLTLAVITLLFAGILLTLQNPVAIDESLRHIAMAKVMRSEGLLHPGGWGDFLYHGYFTERNSDPWFLYHVLLVPLAHLPTTTVQKIHILITTLFFGGVWLWICRWRRLPAGVSAMFLLVLLLGNMQFTLRLFLARPASLLAALSLATVPLVIQRRYGLLAVLLACSTVLTHLFVFPLLITLAAIAWHLYRRNVAVALRLSGIAVLAIAMGLWLHPHTANYMHYLVTVFSQLPFLLQLNVGTEMMSGLGREASLLTILGLCVLTAFIGLHHKRFSPKQFHEAGVPWLAALVGVLTVGFFIWVRMIDFLWPLAVLLLAILISFEPYFIGKSLRSIVPDAFQKRWVYLAALCLILGTNAGKLAHAYRQANTHTSLETVAAALEPVPAGSTVLNVDWDLFPMLMNVRPDLRYARGMDPGFNYVTDARTGPLFRSVDSIPYPEVWLRQALRIFPDTDAIVLWTHKHPKLLRFFRSTDRLQTVYPQGKISTFILQ